MRKFYMFFIALFVSGFVSYASAQRFPISFDVSQKITHADRFINPSLILKNIFNCFSRVSCC